MATQPLQIQGIARSKSKLAVDDGQAEDLINLRFKDGSWRTAGDGKRVFSLMSDAGKMYTQLYVHTGPDYKHLLGVANDTQGISKLWWFANIIDGEFEALDTAVEICNVADGDLYITQTGHLLTIIDSADDFEYAVFKKGADDYVIMGVDSNGSQDSRDLYPFGKVSFNVYSPEDSEHTFSNTNSDAGDISLNYNDYDDTDPINWNDSGALLSDPSIWHAMMLEAYNKITERNQFTRPFVAVVCVNLYDGSRAFTSNPIYLFPNEKLSSGKKYYDNSVEKDNNNSIYKIGWVGKNDGYKTTGTETRSFTVGYVSSIPVRANAPVLTTEKSGAVLRTDNTRDPIVNGASKYPTSHVSNFSIGASRAIITATDLLKSLSLAMENVVKDEKMGITTRIYGSDMFLSLDGIQKIIDNKDVFSGISIYITPQADLFDMSSDGWRYNNGQVAVNCENVITNASDGVSVLGKGISRLAHATYVIKRKSDEEIIYNLTHSPFYLLREYTIPELEFLRDNPVVDLSSQKYNGVLSRITDQKQLKYESTSRSSYIPKVAYQYNGRLHIANYKSTQFHGYPIDLFQLHNHSVKYQEGANYLGLHNLANNNDEYLQFNKAQHNLLTTPYTSRYENIAMLIKVTLDTQQGEQVVCRYIPIRSDYTPYNSFIEDLNPLLTFPDSRAKSMVIFMIRSSSTDTHVLVFQKTLSLTPHPYLNMAYYINPDLRPIDFTTSGVSIPIDTFYNTIKEKNNEEVYPNGLKVSLTNNPFFFPVEQAYQVGNEGIIALCSNAIAVGTGQTGAAPLYVFCKDGVYALFVDADGEMAYTNSRIIARDVCNNAKSVTPIDAGVVFTTDRGLMMIAGEQVQEIGQIAEGDVLDYKTTPWAYKRNGDAIYVGNNMLTQIAKLPDEIVDGVNFLEFLCGSIINYNHNERELMVSNPDYPYTYILDQFGNWSRRNYSADEYVNNYPTSYRVVDGVFYKVDEEPNQLAGVSEAPNDLLYLSNIIKLGTTDFKSISRIVVRGKFDTEYNRNVVVDEDFYDPIQQTHLYSKGSDTPPIKTPVNGEMYVITPLDDNAKQTSYTIRVFDSNGNLLQQTSTGTGVRTLIVEDWSNVEYVRLEKTDVSSPTGLFNIKSTSRVLGVYALGSYDGTKFALMGGFENNGRFTDIGCKVERTDIKYLRVALAGHLSGDSRIDFIEIEGNGSSLNTKLR